ncbi:MAG: hypothetical protein AAGA48_14635 [Myxococcota bacterium]
MTTKTPLQPVEPTGRRSSPGKVKAASTALDVGVPIDGCTVGAKRVVVTSTSCEGDVRCQVFERDGDGGWHGTAELPVPSKPVCLRTDGDHLVVQAAGPAVFTSARNEGGSWSAFEPLPLPEMFDTVRDILLRDELLVVTSDKDRFGIYAWNGKQWRMRHRALPRTKNPLGRPLAINARQDMLVAVRGGFAILVRDGEGGWTRGPKLRIGPFHRNWSPGPIETVFFTDNTVALASPTDATDAPGYATPITGRMLPESGTVFVSSRDDGGEWSPFATLMPPRPRLHERFGTVISGTNDGALLIASAHQASLRSFLYARDAAGQWQLRAQLPDRPLGWLDMDGSTVFHHATGSSSVGMETFGQELLDVPLPRPPGRRRVRRPTAELSYIVSSGEATMGEFVAACDDLVAVTVGADTVHLLRFGTDEAPPRTEHVVQHPDEWLVGALAVDQARVAILWEQEEESVARPQVLARQSDGTWVSEPVGIPIGTDVGWAESCVVLSGDWLLYGRRGDASYICVWKRTSSGWEPCFEAPWPHPPHSIALDSVQQRVLIASEWEGAVHLCALSEEGLDITATLTEHGGPSVFHDDAVLVARRDGIHWFQAGEEGWRHTGTFELPRDVPDDLIAQGEFVYAASSAAGRTGPNTGKVHILRRNEDDDYVSCLVFRDYCQAVEGYDIGGTLAVAGCRVLVGFPHRFDQAGGIQVAMVRGLE